MQVLLNGDNANTATTVMGYATTIVRSESARYLPVAPPGSSSAPLVSVEPRVWYNPALRSTLFLVPGLIAYIAMITAVVSTALSIVREKERGTMEQVRMAPLDAASFVVGKTIPYFVVSLRVGVRDHRRRDGRCSACRCAARGCCCSWRCRCSSSARSASGC